MVLATILYCALCVTNSAPENAADAWNVLFEELRDIEIPYGEQSAWSDAQRAQYEQLRPLMIRAREIATMPNCDWNLEYSEGLNLLIPYVSDIRQAAILINHSIQDDAKADNYASSLSGMESLVGISNHISDDDIITCSLVSYSVFSMLKENTLLFESVQDPATLEPLLDSLQQLDAFDPFGIRAGVAGEQKILGDWLIGKTVEDLDLGGFIDEELNQDLDMEFEVARYDEAMGRLVDLFQMKDESNAVEAMEALQEEVASGEFGELTKVLFISGNNLLNSAFNASKDVAQLQELLQHRIDILRAPNGATYFLQAVDSYCSIDVDERIASVEKGEFEILKPTLALLSTAAEMQPTKITLADDPQTPSWLAPIFAMTVDSLARGTTGDFITALRVAAHLSQQERFAASLAASMIVEDVIDSLPQRSEEETAYLLEAIRRIPAADAFMILATTKREQVRFEKWMSTEEGWNPTPMALLAATVTLAKENKIDSLCGDSWNRLIAALGVPDEDTVVLAAVTQNMSDALLVAEFENEEQFVKKLRHATNQLPALRRKLTTPHTRR